MCKKAVNKLGTYKHAVRYMCQYNWFPQQSQVLEAIFRNVNASPTT